MPIPATCDVGGDSEALQALAQGDRKRALEILMDSYGDALYQYCYRHLRDRTLVEDVVQTVFLQAFADLGNFSGESFRPWLYAIAHNRCIDAGRVHGRWSGRFTLQPTHEDTRDPGPSSEERLMAMTLDEALDGCLMKLALAVRTAILLRYVEGFSYVEMAGVFKEHPATLEARVRRALPVLRRCLESKGFDLL